MKNFFSGRTLFLSPSVKKSAKKGFTRILTFFLVIAVLNLTHGCNYFKAVRTVAPVPSGQLDGLNYEGKSFILHFGGKKWAFKALTLQNDSISGYLEPYSNLPVTKEVKPGKPQRYVVGKKYDQRYLLNEVHLYLNEYAELGTGKVIFPVSAVEKVDVYDKDTAMTVGSWFLGIAGGLALAYLAAAVIVLIFKESCPFIYTWDGEQYHFAGEIYSGTIYKPLERHDYLKLPSYPGNVEYKIKITNEVREIQHTNLLELMVVDHPEGSNVWVDKSGQVFPVASLIPPFKAVNTEGREVTSLLAGKDNSFYQSDPSGTVIPDRDALIMEFPRPEATSAALVIRAKNSILLDYMMGEFNQLFGDAYQSFVRKRQGFSGERLSQWSVNQGIPLDLSVERNGKWEHVDYYNVVGPMAFKEDVLGFALNGNESNPLRVKLEFGYFFWEIDYTGLGIINPAETVTTLVPAASAINEAGEDVSGCLKSDDQQYYTQPETTNFAEISFTLPELTTGERSLFLHSKGWYQILMDPKGKPDRKYLMTFREPGRFNQFVAEKFSRLAQLAGSNK